MELETGEIPQPDKEQEAVVRQRDGARVVGVLCEDRMNHQPVQKGTARSDCLAKRVPKDIRIRDIILQAPRQVYHG